MQSAIKKNLLKACKGKSFNFNESLSDIQNLENNYSLNQIKKNNLESNIIANIEHKVVKLEQKQKLAELERQQIIDNITKVKQKLDVEVTKEKHQIADFKAKIKHQIADQLERQQQEKAKGGQKLAELERQKLVDELEKLLQGIDNKLEGQKQEHKKAEYSQEENLYISDHNSEEENLDIVNNLIGQTDTKI